MEKIEGIKTIFEEANMHDLPDIISRYQEDPRSGVVKLVERYKRKVDQYTKELERIEKMREFEEKYAEYDFIAGIDEVGRGPLAGPVITCALILPKGCRIPYVNDSKQLSEKKREELHDEILKQAIAVGIGSISHEKIDEINILQATYEAMRQSISNLSIQPNLLLIDALHIPNLRIKQVSIVKGDTRSISIAAASIVAKVTRDRLMLEYDKIFPEYGFFTNKGYGSNEHIKALKEYGPSKIHRKSFIKHFMTKEEQIELNFL